MFDTGSLVALAQVRCHKPNTAGDPEGFHQEPAACQYKLPTAFSEYLLSQKVNVLFLVHTQVVASHYEPDLTDAEMSHILGRLSKFFVPRG